MGLIGIGVGTYLIVKAYYLNHQVMFLDWAERKWGPGAGTTAYRIGGLALCILSIFVLTGWIDFVGTTFGQNGNNGQNSTGNQIEAVPTRNNQTRIVE